MPTSGTASGIGDLRLSSTYAIDTGASEAPAEAEEAPDFEAIFAAADAGAGEAVFAKCRACHKLDGTDGVGPHLNGIVGKAKGASWGSPRTFIMTILDMASNR